jgi:hypothetical protein
VPRWPSQLEAVVGTQEIRLHRKPAPRAGRCHDRRFRGALDQRRDVPDLSEVIRVADIDVSEGDAGVMEPIEYQFRAAPVEVVGSDELPVRVAPGEGDGDVRSDEPRPSGHQDPHGRDHTTLIP